MRKWTTCGRQQIAGAVWLYLAQPGPITDQAAHASSQLSHLVDVVGDRY